MGACVVRREDGSTGLGLRGRRFGSRREQAWPGRWLAPRRAAALPASRAAALPGTLACIFAVSPPAGLLPAPQAFGPGLAAQVSEPLLFVDYLREPRRDEATGEVVEARPRCASGRGGCAHALACVRCLVGGGVGGGRAPPCLAAAAACNGSWRPTALLAGLHRSPAESPTCSSSGKALPLPRSTSCTRQLLRSAPKCTPTGTPCPLPCSCYESVPGGMEEVWRRMDAFQARFNEGSRTLKMELVLFQGGWYRLYCMPGTARST